MFTNHPIITPFSTPGYYSDDIKYDDITITFKDILTANQQTQLPSSSTTKTFLSKIQLPFKLYFHSFLLYLTLLFQIYYFSTLSSPLKKLYIFSLGFIYFTILSSLSCYFQNKITQILSVYYSEKKYYEMGNLFKKSLVITEIMNICFYYPLKWLVFDTIFTKYFLRHHFISIENDGIDYVKYGSEKLDNFLFYNFLRILIETLNNFLGSAMKLFNERKLLNINSILYFVINIVFVKIYLIKHGEGLFLKGIGLAYIISNSTGFFFLLCTRRFMNIDQEAWGKFITMYQISAGESFKDVIKYFNVIQYFKFFIIHTFEAFFLLIYLRFCVLKENIGKYTLLFILLLTKHLFFNYKANDKEEIIGEYYNRFAEGNNNKSSFGFLNSNTYNKLSYEFDSNEYKSDNYHWLRFLKGRIYRNAFIYGIIALFLVLFYFVGGFNLFKVPHTNAFAVLVLAFSAFVQNISLSVMDIFECVIGKNTIVLVLGGFGISFGLFWIVKIIIGDILWVFILVMFGMYYVILYRLYPQVKNADLNVVNIEKGKENEKINKSWNDGIYRNF